VKHLVRLFDDVGIFQHATGTVPAREHGYCVDDVGRALPVVADLAATRSEACWSEFAYRCLAYLLHAHTDGHNGLRNFMGYDRQWLDHPHGGDHVGRAIGGLTRFLEGCDEDGARLVATRLRASLIASLLPAHTLHTCAYVLPALGPDHAELARDMAAWLDNALTVHSRRDWVWFDRALSYDNARVPLALVSAGRLLKRDDLVERGVMTLDWYRNLVRRDDCFRFPGTGGLIGGAPLDASGDEQPLEASAMVEAELTAFAVTGDQVHRDAAVMAFQWFTGRNRLGLALADPETGGCGDGLTDRGVNANQGAESTLAYLSARALIERMPVQATPVRA
jgi:hypothetical protein